MKRAAFLFLILFVLFNCIASSQWKLVGNYYFGRNTYTLHAKGQYLFAGTDYGLFRSSDLGRTWTQDGYWTLGQFRVKSIVEIGDKLIAGSESKGVYCSSDLGNTWAKKGTDLDTLQISTMIVWKDTIFAGTNHGIYISTDEGDSWHPRNIGIEGFAVLSIIGSEEYIYAGTDGRGFLRSSDGGISWERKNEGLRSALTSDRTTLYAVARQGSRLFAGSYNSYFFSDNNGDSWTERTIEGYEGYDRSITAIFATDSFIYFGAIAQVLCSKDNGNSWHSSGGNTIESHVTVFCSDGPFLYAGGSDYGDIFYKVDTSEEWNILNTRTTRSYISSFLAFGDKMLLNMTNHTFSSSDRGQTWAEKNKDCHQAFYCFYRRGNEIWGGAVDGIFISPDDGVNWSPMNAEHNSHYVEFLKWHNGKLFAGTLYGLISSTDDGQTWTTLRTDSTGIYDATDIAFDSDRIYVRTERWGFYESFDNGTTWTSTKFGLDSAELTCGSSLHSDSFVLVLGDTLGKRFSYDYGRTWSDFHPEINNFYTDCYLISGNAHFYGTDLGVFLSKDNGKSWKFENDGLPTFESWSSKLSGLYLYGDTLYLTTGEGLFKASLGDFGINPTEYIPIDQSELELYPSPADNVLTLKIPICSGQDSRIDLLDLLGNRIKSATIPAGEFECHIALDGLLPGIYFVKWNGRFGKLVKI